MAGQNKERNYAMNKILIIDDDRELCALIKRSVQSEHIEADFCNTGKEGLQKLKEQEYQLVVLDVMMPGMDGFETLEEIRKENSLPILMFTSKNDSASKVRGLRAGADDYLTKPFELEVLYARVQAILRRTKRAECTQLFCDEICLDRKKQTVSRGGCEAALAASESRLLEYLLEQKGRTVTRRELLEKIWDSGGNFVNDNTLTVTMKRLRERLGNPACIKTVRSFGYRMEDTI